MLIAHKLKIDAVHSSTSNDIQILQNIQPSCHDPEKTKYQMEKKQTFAMFQLHCLLIGFTSIIQNLKSVALNCQQTPFALVNMQQFLMCTVVQMNKLSLFCEMYTESASKDRLSCHHIEFQKTYCLCALIGVSSICCFLMIFMRKHRRLKSVDFLSTDDRYLFLTSDWPYLFPHHKWFFKNIKKFFFLLRTNFSF